MRVHGFECDFFARVVKKYVFKNTLLDTTENSVKPKRILKDSV